MKVRFEASLGALGLLATLILVWWAASTGGLVSRVFLPTPQATVESLLRGLSVSGEEPGALWGYAASTTLRMLLGWLLASFLGVLLGALIGVSDTVRVWIRPTLDFMRPLPASALLPLAISIFGLSQGMVLSVVAFGAMWPVLMATIHGFASVGTGLQEVARCLQISKLAFVLKMGLPNAMPDILAGMRLSMTVSLIVAIVGEMIASQAGLGQAILLAARSFRADDLFAGIVLLGLIGLATNSALAFAERRLLHWQRP